MKRNAKFTREQRLALLKECVASELTIREYTTLKNIGYSTLTGWATQEGISLVKEKKKIFSNPQPKVSLEGKRATFNADLKYKHSGGFSFIDVTGYTKDDASSFSSPINFYPVDENLSRKKDSPRFCGMEIRMPNGVTLKVDNIPFQALWPQVVGFVRALA